MKNILLLIILCVFYVSESQAQNKPKFVPGNIIVQVPNGQIDQVVAKNRVLDGLPTNLKLNRLLSAPMAAYLLEFDETVHHQRLLKQIWDNPNVTLVQFNHYVQNRNTTPNDSQFGDQWWHINNGSGGGTADADIDSDEAWDITTGGVTATGDTIVVCVVDDGGDLDHPDLMANNWVNHNEIPNNNIDDDGNGYIDDYLGWNPVDDNDDVDGGSHGVSVAGMIGAVGNNGTGVSGVNWNVKIMNMTYGNINQEANVVEAYTYPLVMRKLYEQTSGAKGAFVVATNSSWGINYGDPVDAPLWCAFYDTLGEAGILSAGATANLDIDIDVEGDLPTACSSEYMISVTATNNQDVRTFSGYGATTVDLGAPGEDVLTTDPGGNYGETSGTSFASPATAGAVALVYSAPCASLAAIAHSNPALAAQMVRDAIFDGVDPVANLSSECATGGRLNLKGALDQILMNCSSGGCMPPFTLTASNVIDVSADISWSALAGIDSFNISYGEVGGAMTAVFNYTDTEYELENLSACSDYWFIAQSICDGLTSDWSDTLFFSTDGCCEPPTGLVLSDVTDSTITASWNPVLAADTFMLSINGNILVANAGTSTSHLITGLLPCTEYFIAVGTICSGQDVGFSNDVTVTTTGCGACTDNSYCESSGSTDFEWIGNVTVDALDNSTGFAVSGYEDFTDMSVDLQRGETYDVSLTPEFDGQAYTEHFRIWIDIDQNGTFSVNELLFDDDQGSQNTVTGDITIPLSALLGSTRMRVSMAYGSQFGGDYPQTPCDDGQDGEVEDYCVNILEEDSVVNAIQQTDAELGILVYPVPTTNLVTIEVDKSVTMDNAKLQVLDMTGRIVLEKALISKRTMLDLTSLADGAYIITVLQAKTVQGRTRILKE